MDGGDHLWVAGNKPRRGVVVVDLGVAGNDADDKLCGCRSLGESELVVVVVLEARV